MPILLVSFLAGGAGWQPNWLESTNERSHNTILNWRFIFGTSVGNLRTIGVNLSLLPRVPMIIADILGVSSFSVCDLKFGRNLAVRTERAKKSLPAKLCQLQRQPRATLHSSNKSHSLTIACFFLESWAKPPRQSGLCLYGSSRPSPPENTKAKP